MDPHVKTECSACGRPATKKCLGCQVHVYCDTNCQKQDWKVHKTLCKIAQEEKIVKRAADVLKGLYLAFREATFDNVIKKVKKNTAGEIEVWDGEMTDKKNGWFVKFPDHLVKAEVKDAVLTAWVCNEPLAFMKAIVEKLFSESRFKMHELDVSLGSPAQAILCHKTDGSTMRNWPAFSHALIRLASPLTGREWVIDVAGSQYGIVQSSWDWETYQHKFGVKLNREDALGTNEALVRGMSKIEGYPTMTYGLGMKSAHHLHSIVAAWEDAHGIKLCDLLRVPDEDFVEHHGAMLDNIKTGMLRYASETDTSKAFKTCMLYEFFH